MRKYVKEFFLRGMLFGGFGPVIMGIIYAIIEGKVEDFSATGCQICLSIISTYLLAFVHAGASVFNQIEHWSLMKSVFFHSGSLYLAYVICYLVNSWIKPELEVVGIFTAIFAVVYLFVWITVFIITKGCARKMNEKL